MVLKLYIYIYIKESCNFIKIKINSIHHEQQLIQLAVDFLLFMLHNCCSYLFLWQILPIDVQVYYLVASHERLELIYNLEACKLHHTEYLRQPQEEYEDPIKYQPLSWNHFQLPHPLYQHPMQKTLRFP